MNDTEKFPDYRIGKGIVKSGSHGVYALMAAMIAREIPGVPVEHKGAATAAVFVALEFIRNALKVRFPRFFSWL